MKIAVFDIDDTLIIHGKGSQNYYTTVNNNFRKFLEEKKFDKIYIYTNGTWGHGYNIVNHLNIHDMVSFIYGRDNLQPLLFPKHMKPNKESFDFVNASIIYDSGAYGNNNVPDIYFFDDLKSNLETAKSIGWKTILIQPNNELKEHYIDHVFTNIYSALLNLRI